MSKIGLQSQNGTIPDFNKVIDKHPIAWLLLGNAIGLQLARDIRAASPSTLILLRTGGDWAYRDDAWNQAYLDHALQVAAPFQAAGLVDMLLPPNEPIVWNDVEARQLNDRQVWYAGQLKAHGYRTGAYCFSVGNPDYALWQYLLDGIRACDGWLFLHQYDVGSAHPEIYADTSLRHRKVKPLIAPDIDLKIGFTECLVDLNTRGDLYGHGGGYRALPDNGHLIEDYTAHLAWWDGELAKDAYVKFATIFGYSMLEPWAGLGFDVAQADTDRNYFITWLGSGLAPIPPVQPPQGLGMSDQDRAWQRLGVNRNPGAAIYKAALALYPDAVPLGNEDYYVNDQGVEMVAQNFNFATGRCKKGDWANISFHRYLDDALWQKWATGGTVDLPALVADLDKRYALKGQGGGIAPLPYAFPSALTAIGAVGEAGIPTGGQPFYRLTGAAVRQGVSAFMVVTVIGKNGVPVVGAKVLNLFPDGNGEIIQTDGSGVARFQFGASSAFTQPGTGPFTICVVDDSAFKDSDSIPKRVVFKARLSDIVKSLGDFQGQHTEINIQFVEQL